MLIIMSSVYHVYLREIAILEMQIKIITVTVCCHPFYYCTGVTLYNFIGHNNDENKKCVRKGKYGVGFFFFFIYKLQLRYC